MLSSLPAVPRVAVIGGGVAGLSCSLRLAELGTVAAHVFDMGRAPGGRVGARAPDATLSFDHGAQFFAPLHAGSDFDEASRAWVDAGAAAHWSGRFGAIRSGAFHPYAGGGKNCDGPPGEAAFCGLSELTMDRVLVGNPSMAVLGDHLAAKVVGAGGTVSAGCKVGFAFIFNMFCSLLLHFCAALVWPANLCYFFL
jgi:hypothetical protein